jgi:hypothetical protein
MNDPIEISKQLLGKLLERHPALTEAYDPGDLERLLVHINLVFDSYEGPFLSEDIIQEEISGNLAEDGLYFFDLKGLITISMPVVAGKYGFIEQSTFNLPPTLAGKLLPEIRKEVADEDAAEMCAKAALVLFMIYRSDELLNRAIDEDPVLEKLSDDLKVFLMEEIMEHLNPLVVDEGPEAAPEGEEVLAMVDLKTWFQRLLGPLFNYDVYEIYMVHYADRIVIESTVIDGMGMSRSIEDRIWPDGALGIEVSPDGNLTPFPGTDWFHRIPRTEQALIGVLELGLPELQNHGIAGGMLFRRGTTQEEILERHRSEIKAVIMPRIIKVGKDKKQNYEMWRGIIRAGFVWGKG